jgi:hypothetical protein
MQETLNYLSLHLHRYGIRIPFSSLMNEPYEFQCKCPSCKVDGALHIYHHLSEHRFAMFCINDCSEKRVLDKFQLAKRDLKCKRPHASPEVGDGGEQVARHSPVPGPVLTRDASSRKPPASAEHVPANGVAGLLENADLARGGSSTAADQESEQEDHPNKQHEQNSPPNRRPNLWATILDHLDNEGVRLFEHRETSVEAVCPLPTRLPRDRHAMHVRYEPSLGRVFFHCLNGCDEASIIQHLNITDEMRIGDG